ncbi:MAG: hypothetical protein MJ107_01975 [Lachnospiraceae bacterium]|nr:hypothetical protein [Lachnospiraceae bacterium]
MINETRIKLMTRMASYEAGDGKKNSAVARFFRSDYVSVQVIKAIICATIAYMIVFGAYIYYDFENFMANIYKMDLWDFAGKVLKYYVVFTVTYCVIVYIAFSVKYSRARKSLKRYFNNLKLLGTMYNNGTIDAKEEDLGETKVYEKSDGFDTLEISLPEDFNG